MNKSGIQLIAFCTVMCLVHTVAVARQEVKKEEKKIKQDGHSKPIPALPHPAIRDSAFGQTHVYLFPEFYHYWPIDKNDTILRYECFDGNNSLINIDTLHSISVVQHIHFIKTFTNYMRTYIDADGKPGPAKISKTLYRYDKADADTWKGYDYTYKYASVLTEYKNDIVRKDSTVISDPVTGEKELTIRKYYKVVEQKLPAENENDK